MTKKEVKMMAQDLIMDQIAIIGYGDTYEEFVKKVGSHEEAEKVLYQQMNRVAKIFGYEKAWFA